MRDRVNWVIAIAAVVVGAFAPACHVAALEHVAFEQEGQPRQATGRVIVEALDGGLLFEGQDGVLWTIQPEELIDRRSDDSPFRGLDRRALSDRLRRQLSGDFEVHETAHYVLIHNTSPAYARWCGTLYERLYGGFYNFWKTRGVHLQDPETPLVAVVFRDKSSYVRYARDELADAAGSIVGYYSLHTNRMATYDLTGFDVAGTSATRSGGSLRHRPAHIQRLLSQPQAVPLVATLVHEATHQLSYNSGLQSRYVDNPLWLSEGLAMYFETPDLRSDKGWRTIGGINPGRLQRFHDALPSRGPDALVGLVGSDQRMRDPDTALDAYAESWALCHYLLRVQPEAFTAYLAELAARSALSEDSTATRLDRFQRHFAPDIREFDGEFQRYLMRYDRP